MVAATRVRSRPGIFLGVVIAIFVPISYVILSQLVQAGIAPYEGTHSLLGLFGLIGWISLFGLGPLGLVIAGWSAGIRGVGAWIVTIILGLPLLVVIWLVGVVSLSGTLGNPA
jgi:hypothetical protein